MAWIPLQFGLLSGKFRPGHMQPSASRLNSLDAPGNIDEEPLCRIVDSIAEIASQRGARSAAALPLLASAEIRRGS
jgi:aryl-alcohol dehydrogenase-like predicted oxidoreductase